MEGWMLSVRKVRLIVYTIKIKQTIMSQDCSFRDIALRGDMYESIISIDHC